MSRAASGSSVAVAAARWRPGAHPGSRAFRPLRLQPHRLRPNGAAVLRLSAVLGLGQVSHRYRCLFAPSAAAAARPHLSRPRPDRSARASPSRADPCEVRCAAWVGRAMARTISSRVGRACDAVERLSIRRPLEIRPKAVGAGLSRHRPSLHRPQEWSRGWWLVAVLGPLWGKKRALRYH